MITGEVSACRQALLSIDLQDPGDNIQRVEAVLDTGFTKYLTLPGMTIASLGLPYNSDSEMVLADGSVEQVSVYLGAVLGNGVKRTIQVHASEGDILVGMALLHGHHLGMDVIDGGRVTITPLP